jgi:Zn finger protein HypA/HybF involved in hydrogenase expression
MGQVKPENQTDYYKQHPPKCIVDFISQPVWLDNIEYDGHGFSGIYPDNLAANQNIVFTIKCKCGNGLYGIIAESQQAEIWRHKDLVIAEKYFLECSSCHSRRLFFDPSSHGYDAEIFKMEGWGLSENVEGRQSNRKDEKATCECSNCHKATFEVFVRFEYSSDLFEESSFEGKEQELFSWFTGIGKCQSCSTINQFIDFECA